MSNLGENEISLIVVHASILVKDKRYLIWFKIVNLHYQWFRGFCRFFTIMSRLIGSLKNYIEILFEIQCIHCTCVRSKSQLYHAMEKFGWGDLFISKHTCCKCFNNAEKRFCASVSVSFFISSHTWYTSVGLSKIQSHVFYVWFLYDKILDD